MSLARRLASQSAVIFAARLFGAGLMFVGQAAIARFWGQAVLGEYLIVIASANLIAAFMPLGFQTIGTYFASEYRARMQGGLIRRFALMAYLQWAGMALVVALGGLSLLKLVGPSTAVMAAHFPSLAAIAAASALMFVNSSLLVGLKRPFAGFLVDALFRPLLVIGGFVTALTLIGGGVDSMLVVFATAYGLVVLVQFVFTIASLRRIEDSGEEVPVSKEVKRWWRFATPWVLIALATDFFFDLDLVVLSTLLPPGDLAIFGVCARIFSLAAFGVSAVYAVTLPDVFEAEAGKDRDGFLKRIGDANLVASGLSLVLFAFAGLLGPFALLLFGPGFLSGSGPLAVLCLSLAVRSVFGPTSLVLSIYDHPYASLPAVAAGLLTLVVMNLVLVPLFGLMGASVAALIAITVWSGALWLVAKHMTGIDVSIMPRLNSGVNPARAILSAE